MSLFCDRLKFCLGRPVKSSTRSFNKFADVVGLENVAAKEDARRSCGGNVADHIESVFVRSMTASTQHENWYGTLFHYRVHGGYVPTVIRLNSIRAKLDCHTSVEVQPLRIAWILHILSAGERFNNQRDSNSLTFAGDFGVASDFVHLKLSITGTHDEIGENGIGALP